MKKRHPGPPRGNQNARREGEENDGQLLIRLPRERVPRMRAATYVTGDRGLSAFVRRILEAELDRVEGARVGVIIDQPEAERVLRDAGHIPPSIPEGANTAELWFRTAEGRPALAINQTGFDRTAGDAGPINGCTVFVLTHGDLSDEEGCRAILSAVRQVTE